VTDRQAATSVPRAPCLPRVRTRGAARASARGFSLIIAMLMLAVIGLASAAIMRGDAEPMRKMLDTLVSDGI